MAGGVGYTGGLTNSRPWRGRCRASFSNTGGPPLPRKRAPLQKKPRQNQGAIPGRLYSHGDPGPTDLDERATTQELKDLEADARRQDAILEDWQTPPGSPWERSEDTTYNTTSLLWNTVEITFGTPPRSWDAEEIEEKPSANRTSTVNTESDDSLPELVSDITEKEDDGFVILNTPTSGESNEETKIEEEKKTDGERARKNQKIFKEIDRRDNEALMEELAVDEILDMRMEYRESQYPR